jgi:hypothetical protein
MQGLYNWLLFGSEVGDGLSEMVSGLNEKWLVATSACQ